MPASDRASTNVPAPRRFAPDLSAERAFWSAGFEHVAGIDEVGRGALAGPLVAAAVVLPASGGRSRSRLARALRDVRDSKMLSAAEREALIDPILEYSLATAVGIVDAPELDQVGLSAANRIAMERAALGLSPEPDFLLLDACTVDLGIPQSGRIDADARCLSVAAASILAKVTRDAFMVGYDQRDARYAFHRHKGYGSALHLARLQEHGPCPLHRRSFAPIARLLPSS